MWSSVSPPLFPTIALCGNLGIGSRQSNEGFHSSRKRPFRTRNLWRNLELEISRIAERAIPSLATLHRVHEVCNHLALIRVAAH